MEITVTGRNVEVPDHFRGHVEEKLSRLERYDHKIVGMEVELFHEPNPRQQKSCQRLEITGRGGCGAVARAEAAAGDFYAALDLAVSKLAGRLRRSHDRGIALYVYSSGSVEAQQLIFGHTAHGDLRGLFSGYFDTRTGPKREAASYTAIVRSLGLAPQDVLFLSDVGEELDAARAAGLQTCQLLRDERAVPFAAHRGVDSFAALEEF